MRIYDTLSRQLIDFEPRDPGRVGIYACGLTPQAPAHLGHMRGAVLMDVVRRWLRHIGYEVDFVQNFTDVDDKIINRSREEGISPAEVAKKYSRLYLNDLAALGIEPARWVYVTENMPVIIEMIEKIVERGKAYEVDGDVYFRVQSTPEYGKLSRRKLSDMQAGARIEVDERKEHPMDFAIWKAAKPGEPSWDSPWGPGRPGWHIECSALSLKEFGADFDIHAGGVDLIFPHHENEIAQSEAYLDKPQFARIWMHWGSVQLAERKMSKSEDVVMGVREALERFPAGAIRLYLLGTGYRSPIEYSDARMEDAQRAFDRLRAALNRAKQMLGDAVEGPADDDLCKRFAEAMNDDFNTAAALATLHDTIGQLNERMAEGLRGQEERAAELVRTAEWFGGILGLPFEEPEAESALVEKLMAAIIEWRQELRIQKQFAVADSIRKDLNAIGVLLEDGPEGTTWRRS
ncbi:MAG: cysteine--tRNA ligase [Armatimonadetes bacterium]|nr:cysteine--tRNA ligase [Armatimonadota bacterium]